MSLIIPPERYEPPVPENKILRDNLLLRTENQRLRNENFNLQQQLLTLTEDFKKALDMLEAIRKEEEERDSALTEMAR